MQNKLNWVIDRLGENSTWRGIIGLLTAAGVAVKPEVADKIIAAGIALIALINVFRVAPPSASVVAEAVKSGDTTTLEKKPSAPLVPLILITFALCLGMTGCVTGTRLEAGGAYSATATSAANPELYVVDSSFDLAYAALNATFTYEKANRVALWQLSPKIKQGLDKLRLEASRVVYDYALARSVYIAAPTPAGLTAMSQVLMKLQTANEAALTVIATKGGQ